MILINNRWEKVNNIEDILRICRENIGDEFAKEIRSILHKRTERLEEMVDDLNSKVKTLESNSKILLSQIDDYEIDIEQLVCALDEATYEVVSLKNPRLYDVSDKKKEYLKELFGTYKIPMEYMPD